ncbi:MAG: NADH:flavin oxidoreductase/NADH oxidase [Micrococcales bacterium]|nr:NADH:flavin oxidoreductase/NADH oxidase [Micrococcales bacterium]
MAQLFSPITLRSLTVRNRVWLPPLCQFCATDGLPDDWHLTHLGARAAGGFGMIIAEATAVTPEGRITAHDLGLWDDAQVEPWARTVRFVHERGAAIAVQLQHAGRKGSVYRPYGPGAGPVPLEAGGWVTSAPSALAFPGLALPRAMSADEIAAVPGQFADAARRALAAGFDSVQIHAAHGYLLHQFLSPLTNQRTDAWGGSLEARARLLVEVTDAVRAVWPDDLPIMVRVSATDWADGGLTVDDVAGVCRELADHGLDLVDVTTGGLAPAPIPEEPGYQVLAARKVREVSGLPVTAVGLITDAAQAEQILVEGSADAVEIGRAALRDPSWPLRAAHELGVTLPDPAFTGAGATIEPGQPTGFPPQHARGAWH